MYKELFKIRYCKKDFLVLAAPDHRKTFLEIKDGELVYPDINDFLKLHKIFNDKSVIYNIVSHDYIEKVDIGNRIYRTVGPLLLGLTIGVTVVNPVVNNIMYQNLNKDYEDQYRYIVSLYNNQEVTREDVIKVINANDNFNDFQKDTAIEVLDLLLEKDSTANLRVYYENVKTMTICPFDEKDEKLVNVEAYYQPVGNTIHMRHLDGRDVLKHELCHSIHHFLCKENGRSAILKDSYCGCLEEPMTNLMVDIPELSYSFECRILRFFWDASDNFSYHDYNEKGIKALADELKQKYKGVDIDYLFDAYDAYHTLLFNQDIAFNRITKQKDLLDETFKIVVANIDKDHIMDSFNSFINIFNFDENEEVFKNYYPQYLKALLEKNYISQEQYVLLNEIRNLDSIAFVNDSFYMANSLDKLYYDTEGNKNNNEDASYLKIGRRNMLENIELLLKYNNCYDKDFMEEFIKSLDLDVAEFKNSVIDLSARYEELTKIVETMFEIKTSNIADNSKLPGIVSNINNGFNNMRSYTVNTKYFDLLSQNNLLSKDIEDFLNNAQGFTYENGRLVIINNINMPLGVLVLDGKRMNPSVYIMHGNKLNIEDNNGEKQSINGELIYIYEVNSMFKQEFMEIFNPELSLEENINNVLNRNNEIKIYDNRLDIAADFNLEDSMVIEIGRNKANYCYKITNNGKIVSKSCDTFDERTIKIPLTDFITIARNVAINEKLCFDSSTIEEVLFYLKSIYPSINGTISFENAESWHIGIDGELESIGYTAMKSSIKIIEPKSVSVDNVDYLLNDLFIAKYDNSYYLRLSNTKIIELGTFDNVNDTFIYLESILDKERINDNSFTLEELVDIANNYLTGEVKQSKTK